MKKGETLIIAIDRLGPDGVGFGTVGSRTVQVPGTVPGDVARVRVTGLKRHMARGVVESLDASGAERIEAPCPHFAICGGCRWQDIPYAVQLDMKAGILRSVLEGIDGCERFNGTVVPSPDEYYYRNKMEFTFDRPPSETVVSLGLHELGHFDRVFDLTSCRLESESSNAIIQEVRSFVRETGLTAYGLRSHVGLLRFLVIRESKATGEIMVSIVTSGEVFDGLDTLVNRITTAVPAVSTVIRSINDAPASVAQGGDRDILTGNGIITEQIADLAFIVSPDSFFQTNSHQAANLYATIGDFCRLDGSQRVLDLYCGTGTIGLSVAGRAREVTGIEMVADAVEDARRNAALNGISNATFTAGKVESLLDENMTGFDVVICDPPRAGLHPRAMAELVRMRIPRMVYVSCNSKVLPHDLAVLLLAGYHIVDIRAFDMSPHTPHIETVVLLECPGY